MIPVGASFRLRREKEGAAEAVTYVGRAAI
jgi:hypothetical protein